MFAPIEVGYLNTKTTMLKRINEKYATEVGRYGRIYRDLKKMKILRTTEVCGDALLHRKIERSSKEIDTLNTSISNVNNRVVHMESKLFFKRMSSLILAQDGIDEEIRSIKRKINDLNSQIERVDVKTEKYSTLDHRFNADKKIARLEARILRKNQQMGCLKIESLKFKELVNDLFYMRRRYQQAHDKFITKLMEKKQAIIEVVDHYTLAFMRDMQNCLELEQCRIKSVQQLKDHLQEMLHLTRAAESNNILRDFMITKGNRDDLNTDAIPLRDILIGNYGNLIKEHEDLLTQIEEYAPQVTAKDIQERLRQAFSLYLYSNDITKMIDDSEKTFNNYDLEITNADMNLMQRTDGNGVLNNLKMTQTDEAEITERFNNGLRHKESTLRSFFDNIKTLFNLLECENSILYEAGHEVNEYNLDGVLQVIEIRMRQIMHSVFCWQEQQEHLAVDDDDGNEEDTDKLVHDVEIVKPKQLPHLKLIHSCPECSQVEARANPDIETIMDKDTKYTKIKSGIETRNIKYRMHNIEDCPKPGSKAVLSKDMMN